MEHLAEMAMRAGAPKFMLHDLRKLFAVISKKSLAPDSIVRLLLNHTAPKNDTLNRHYASFTIKELENPLISIQSLIDKCMQNQ